MKTYIKIILLTLIFISAYNSNAQKFGIIGGGDLTKMSFSENGSTSSYGSSKYKHTLGHHIGITMDIPFSERLSLQPSLLYSTKGVKHESSYSQSYSSIDINTGNVVESTYRSESSSKIKTSYLELPVNLKLSFSVGEIKVFGAFGPYVAWGISGSFKGENSFAGPYGSNTEKIEDDIDWGTSSNDMLRRLDYGIGYGVGVEISSFQIGASYNQGLANINSYQKGEYSIKNKVIRLSVAYFIGKGKTK